ncbi:hypothetical protein Gotur_012718 [Gossypium turneri]
MVVSFYCGFSLFQKDQFCTLELVIQPEGISDFPIR